MAAFPTTVGIQGMTMRLRSATAMTESTFTYDQQVFSHPGVRWEAEVTLPPMTRSQAKEYEGFFAGLRGMKETFTMGNPLHTTSVTGTVTGAVNATQITENFSGSFVVGDYFSVSGHLHIITEIVNATTIKVMPPLRQAASGATVDFTLPSGVWRLASNEIGWSINEASIYGFSFACIEAI
jgi:hypothetical protein